MMNGKFCKESRGNIIVVYDSYVARFFSEIDRVDDNDLVFSFYQRKEVEAQGPAVDYINSCRKGISFLEGVYRVYPDSFVFQKYIAEPYDSYGCYKFILSSLLGQSPFYDYTSFRP